MKNKIFIMLLALFCTSVAYAANDKVSIPPPGQGWSNTNDYSISTPQLFQDESCVHVYSEKLLDNLSIGITYMQGNVYHYEVTTVPACTYYVASIESLPAGTFYQGSNYVIGIFQK